MINVSFKMFFMIKFYFKKDEMPTHSLFGYRVLLSLLDLRFSETPQYFAY
jgi:hypothetical protein